MAEGPEGNSEDIRKKIQNLFKNWITGPQELNLLITGKTGVGKSRLVNTLVGRKVAEEGHEKDPCTSRVDSYEVSIDNVTVKVWDSPGLQDGTGNEDQYIQDMKENIQDLALMIYCVRMDDTRFYDADKKAIRILTNEFGKEVWKHAVVALTFANMVEDPDGEDDVQYFKKKLGEWESKFQVYFASNLGVDVNIPVLPVGNTAMSMDLPDREDWLPGLWIECFHVMKASARLGMYLINKKRLIIGDSTSITERADGHDDEFSTTRIPLNDKQKTRFLSLIWESFLLIAKIGLNVAIHVVADIILPFL